ncbi:RICIN domain-containing protein [Embleya sp. NPDC020886]|uniref:RICIN domain-containing protein n=1 Tax=Embleya sp. NPDC020886 TaxID=3363980 RepID=UPI0037B2B8A5
MKLRTQRPYVMLLLLSLVAAVLVGTAGTATAQSAPPVAGAPEDQPRLLQEFLAKHRPPGLTQEPNDWPGPAENAQLLNWFSRKCMVSLPAADLFGVMQYECNQAYTDQRWTSWHPFDFTNSWQIVGKFVNQCLQVDDATVTTQSCRSDAVGQEALLIIDTTASWFRIKFAYNKCVYPNGTGNSAPVSAYTCGDNADYADQWWTWYN